MRARLFPRATMVAALVAAAIGIAAPQAHGATPAAPGAPGVAHTWAPGDKDGFGTSRSLKQDLVHAQRRRADRDLLPPDRHAEHA